MIMRSPACCVSLILALLACCRLSRAFLPPLSAATTGTTACQRQQHLSCSLSSNLRSRNSVRRRRAAHFMSSGDEESKEAVGPMPEPEPAAGAAAKSPSELMDAAAETNFVTRASSSSGGVMGPAMQPEEEKQKEREVKKAFEMEKQENAWASGAFKRGLALQAVVLSFVIFLSFQPDEIGNLAICAPFTKPNGCVGFGDWVEIVFFGAPIPPM